MSDTTSTAPWLENLNAQQKAAAEHGRGPLLILAGAGTGKTKTLVARLANLIATGTAPERILLVTFSRRGADEMIRRVGQLTDAETARRVDAGTFHAVANRLLRQYGHAFGLPQGFSVIDQGDAADLMNLLRNEHGHGKHKRFPKKDTLVNIYSRTVNAQQPLKDVLDVQFPWCRDDEAAIAAIFRSYTERKRAQDLLDYDDLLLFWRAAAKDERLSEVMTSLYDHVLVDEYQDTNALQADILLGLRRNNDDITVVGDDAQSIYSFRAATVRNILDFPQLFPGTTTVALTQNYRSTQPILDLANAVIADAYEQMPKDLWSAEAGDELPILATCPDERAQVDAVCDEVLRHFEDGIALREQAVLFRAAHHSDALEVELRRRNIPFVKHGGLKFLEAAHVRDLLALLRVLDNPYDELAWFRVLQLLDGVGAAKAQKVMEETGVHPRVEGAADPLGVFHLSDALPRLAKTEAQQLAEAFAECESGSLTVGAQVERLAAAVEPMVKRKYDSAEVRMRDLEALGNLAAEYKSRHRLVTELTLDPPNSTGDLAGPPLLDDDYLNLSTVHSAKGCEWRAVHVIHAADGMFPSDMATGSAESIDEERRLFYVALTRAMEHLSVYAPLRYHHAGLSAHSDAHSYAQRTRFLPPSVDHLLHHRAVRSAHADGSKVGDMPRADLTVTVDSALNDLW